MHVGFGRAFFFFFFFFFFGGGVAVKPGLFERPYEMPFKSCLVHNNTQKGMICHKSRKQNQSSRLRLFSRTAFSY